MGTTGKTIAIIPQVSKSSHYQTGTKINKYKMRTQRCRLPKNSLFLRNKSDKLEIIDMLIAQMLRYVNLKYSMIQLITFVLVGAAAFQDQGF